MKSNNGNFLKYSIFGESHGPSIGATIDGLPAGILINSEKIKKQLKLRLGGEQFNTPRKEVEEFEIISGIYNRKTTGQILTVIIKNMNVNSSSYQNVINQPRPGHADFVSKYKYQGYANLNGGGHFSGRITAALVIIGEICSQVISNKIKNFEILTHIKQVGKINNIGYYDLRKNEIIDSSNIVNSIEKMNHKIGELDLKGTSFPLMEPSNKLKITKYLRNIKKTKNTVGGILETIIINSPVGLGEPFFSSVESEISKILYSIPSVKGVSFGNIDELNSQTGEQTKDEIIKIDKKRIYTQFNNNGGINGGITNGEEIIIKTTVKPIASLKKEQFTYNHETQRTESLKIGGRHDATIINRVCPVINAAIAIVMLDFIMIQKGNK
jgi:chorismate synthase